MNSTDPLEPCKRWEEKFMHTLHDANSTWPYVLCICTGTFVFMNEYTTLQMHICRHVCVYVCAYVSINEYTILQIHICIHVCVYVSVHVCIYEWIYTFIYVCPHIIICVCTCAYWLMWMWLCMFICMYECCTYSNNNNINKTYVHIIIHAPAMYLINTSM